MPLVCEYDSQGSLNESVWSNLLSPTLSCNCDQIESVWNDSTCIYQDTDSEEKIERKVYSWQLLLSLGCYACVLAWLLSAYVTKVHWGDRAYFLYIDAANIFSWLFWGIETSQQNKLFLQHLASGTEADDRIDVGLGSMQRVVIRRPSEVNPMNAADAAKKFAAQVELKGGNTTPSNRGEGMFSDSDSSDSDTDSDTSFTEIEGFDEMDLGLAGPVARRRSSLVVVNDNAMTSTQKLQVGLNTTNGQRRNSGVGSLLGLATQNSQARMGRRRSSNGQARIVPMSEIKKLKEKKAAEDKRARLFGTSVNGLKQKVLKGPKLRRGSIAMKIQRGDDSDVSFAQQNFIVKEDGDDEHNFVLLVRKDTTEACTVTVTSKDLHLGARAGVHYVPMKNFPVHFAKGYSTTRIRVKTLHQANWDSTLMFGLSLDRRADSDIALHHVNWRSCKVSIVNTDEFPRASAHDRKLFDRKTFWPLRIWVFCRYVYDDLRTTIPSYFRQYFILWYILQFIYSALFTSAFLPYLYKRLIDTTIPEYRFSEAILLSALGMFGNMVQQRLRYSYYGYWALGRFNSLRLVRYFETIPYLNLQDTTLNGRFHKLFGQMEACITNTWRAALETLKMFIRLIVVVCASMFLNKDMLWAFPSALCTIITSVMTIKLIQWCRKWPEPDCFFEMEEHETLISDAVDNIISNRVIHRSLRTDDRSVRLVDDGYKEYLLKRNMAWYYIDHNYWSKYWAWASLSWLFVAMSPQLVHDGQFKTVDITTMLYLMVLLGTDLSGLDDNFERFRYGLAQLDYLDDTIANPEYTSFRLRQIEHCYTELINWEDRLNHSSTRSATWDFIELRNITGTEIPESWMQKAQAGQNLIQVRPNKRRCTACDGEEDFIRCNARIPVRGYLCGLNSDHDRFINIKLLWLLSGEVLPVKGHIFRPPRMRTVLIPADLDCTPSAASLMDNLRFGCGSAEVSGLSDDVIWDLCMKLGMKTDLIGSDNVLTRSSVRYYQQDIALMHLAQHLLLFPDLLLINNTRCITPTSLQALSAYAQGGLLPYTALVSRSKKKHGGNTTPTDGRASTDGTSIDRASIDSGAHRRSTCDSSPSLHDSASGQAHSADQRKSNVDDNANRPLETPRRSVIVRLPDDGHDYTQYIDLLLDISHTKPTNIQLQIPKRPIGGDVVRRHSIDALSDDGIEHVHRRISTVSFNKQSKDDIHRHTVNLAAARKPTSNTGAVNNAVRHKEFP